MRVEVVYALPSRCWRFPLALPTGATVADALAAADPGRHIPGLVPDPARLAVFGRPAAPDTVLHPGDRVEILRPLLADPKLARRRRAGQA
ncbi:RnfH family protein [Arenimonas fontis]|uniref:UPF0125 protein F0415_00705 n=2 Tax=Arenimonas fontis TaxID=2608255 RepID=A0A5B2ZE04_9GAMM|nr:RnfH family protein [Arenimonas fontis]KAA2286356.1 RnfH family protein [Arenimonas fontis]